MTKSCKSRMMTKPKVNINIKNLFAGNQDDESNNESDIIDITEDDEGRNE